MNASGTDHAVLISRGRLAAATGRGAHVRRNAGLSLEDVAQAVGVTMGAVWRWENGRFLPKRDTAVRYAQLIDALELEHEVATV